MGAVDLKQDLAVNANGSLVFEEGEQILKMGLPFLFGGGVGLKQKHFLVIALPATGPGLIGPGQAEGNVQILIVQEHLLGCFQDLHMVVKPVMVNGKTADAVFFCQFHLPAQHIQVGQVVIIVVQRNTGLTVTFVQGVTLLHIGPVSKAFAPPGIIFLGSVELGEVQCNNLRIQITYLLCT